MAQIDLRVRTGRIQLCRLEEIIRRSLHPTLLVFQHAQHMPGIKRSRLTGNNLSAARLRLLQPAGLVVGDGLGEEFGRRTHSFILAVARKSVNSLR